MTADVRREVEALLHRSEDPARARDVTKRLAHDLIELFRELHDKGQMQTLQQMPHDIIACDGIGRFCSFLGHCQMKPSTGALLSQLRNHK